MFEHHRHIIRQTNPIQVTGRLTALTGLTVLAQGLPIEVGSLCRIQPRKGRRIPAQVVGFRDDSVVLMPMLDAQGVAVGDPVSSEPSLHLIGVGPEMLGRTLDGLGRTLDGQGPIRSEQFYPVYHEAPKAMSRLPIEQVLATGIRSMDAMLTIGTGQRIGIFAGTGVGKSILLGMISRYTSADVIVMALVGERGREVKDFIIKDLGPEGMKRSVLVVSTSDESPVMRVRACFVATAIAEYFRDQGRTVLLLMDSLTRLAMAQRQIGLAAGEPPATKGYTPSVFALMPILLERAGKTDRGSITGFYSVLVEGDDINEPISDAVRGILDGHVWLSRALAGKGHYPAVDVLNSISRLMVDVVDDEHYRAAQKIRKVLGIWSDIEDLVNIGAYAMGSNRDYDVAIQTKPRIDEFLRQAIAEHVEFSHVRKNLVQLARDITAVEEKIVPKARRVSA